jgi:hypothetical protein
MAGKQGSCHEKLKRLYICQSSLLLIGSQTGRIERCRFQTREHGKLEQYKIAQDVQNLPAFIGPVPDTLPKLTVYLRLGSNTAEDLDRDLTHAENETNNSARSGKISSARLA